MNDDALVPFEAEVGRVLDLVINSLYKDREIFLRELVSNAADACDKQRYQDLTGEDKAASGKSYEIKIEASPKDKTISITDNGVGMDQDELRENLGTIARSGTARFLDAMKDRQDASVQLIGQFGVGFYSAFMVADRVEVTTRKHGAAQAWRWQSDGKSGYTIDEANDFESYGTAVRLWLKDDADEFLSDFRIKSIIRRYSDHVSVPILLSVIKDGEDADAEARENEQINNASALWTRPKQEITDEQYNEFYRHTSHGFDEPFARVHFKVEGVLSYSALLFVPSKQPFDLFDPKRHHAVKLFVRRVFISDDVENLLPRYLRFVTGVVDSEDLQLNVSRETLQHGAVVAKMKTVLVKRVLDQIAQQAKPAASEDGEDAKDTAYLEFWQEFGAVLKEGLYEDHENKDKLLKLLRVKTTHGKEWSSLDDYIARMPEGQDAIYYISGENADALRSSPQLEIAASKGIEAILLDDPVDEFWAPEIQDYDGKKFISLTKGDLELPDLGGSSDKEDESSVPENSEKLLARIKLALGDQVKDVRASNRLKESAVCLVADAGGMDMRMERFLKQHSQLDQLGARILEVNCRHDLLKQMAQMIDDEARGQDIDELSKLLLDQARIIEGEPIADPGAFSRRMSRFLVDAVQLR